ncbi:MAG TPA: hypothetical protein PLV94_03525, partial [Spirochaetota bacterium]|nr:hypothetical protein [Spirochaetota bacterium]
APNTTLNQFNASISEVLLALSRCGLRPPRGQCFYILCKFANDINKMIRYLRELPVRSEYNLKSI